MAKVKVTEKQKAIMDFIRGYTEENGKSPVMREIAEKFGISIPGVITHLAALRKKGLIEQEPYKHRGLKIAE